MWDGVSDVQPSWRPVVHEGSQAAHIIVTNAGPGIIDLMVWSEPPRTPDAEPDVKMRMAPGNTRSATGWMIAIGSSQTQVEQFAAFGWRMVH